jgi:hypothetical protein
MKKFFCRFFWRLFQRCPECGAKLEKEDYSEDDYPGATLSYKIKGCTRCDYEEDV